MLAVVKAAAACALLTMILDTMIPEAVDGERKGTGALVALGLRAAFALSNVSGSSAAARLLQPCVRLVLPFGSGRG